MIYPKSLWEMSVLLDAYQKEYGEAVDKLEDQMEEVYGTAHKEVERLAKAYKKKLETLVEQSTLATIVKQATNIASEMSIILGGGTPDLVAMGIDLGLDEGASTKGLDEIDPIASFEEAVAKLNIALRDLSTIDLEAMTPPEVIEKSGHGKDASFTITGGVNEGTYTYSEPGRYQDRAPNGIAGPVCIVYALCNEVISRAQKLQDIVDRACDIGDFECFFHDCASEWCAKRREEMSVSRDNLFEELYGEGKRAIDPAFFAYHDSARDGGCDTYIEKPFTGFKDRIDLGFVDFYLADDYANFSHLSEHIVRGYYDVPLLLNLKQQGNLFIFPQSNTYAEAVGTFVNQVILQFLAAAPVGKMKLCLVDVENRFSLSPYKILDKVDPSILFKGIIRDDRQLEDTIKDMEQIMYRVSDDVLSFNGVSDIFEYNEKFADKPEAMHLLVISNEQAIQSEDLRRRLQNIMLHGNRCGIYTILVSPQGCCPDSVEGLHNQSLVDAYNPLFEAVIDTTIGVDFCDDNWVTSCAPEIARFTPACETVGKDKVSISRLPALVEEMLRAKE